MVDFKDVVGWDLISFEEKAKEYAKDAEDTDNEDCLYFKGKAEAYAFVVKKLKLSIQWTFSEVEN